MYSFFYTAGIGEHGSSYADMVAADSETAARQEFWKRRANASFDWVHIDSIKKE